MQNAEITDNAKAIQAAILQGYHDLAAGRFFESTGDFEEDMKILAHKEEVEGW
jgi:antitoxin ParD1/3/4